LDRIYGPPDSPTRQQNNVYQLVEKASPGSFPYLYLAVGTTDTLALPGNREMTALLQKRGFRYEYHEVPGGHEWPVWDREVLNFLQLAERMFNNSKMRSR
jgi:enterochelin esterase-like enzyme